jgi:hypothetical protein
MLDASSRSVGERSAKKRLRMLFAMQWLKSIFCWTWHAVLTITFARLPIGFRIAAILSLAATLHACERVSTSDSDATLIWRVPMEHIDGSPISDLAGYYIYYGDTPTALMHVVQLRDPAMTGYIVRNLPRGVHYFSVSAYTASGVQSGLAVPVSKVIP